MAGNQRELLKGSTPSLLLAILADGPRHGYAIAREIERRTDRALRLGEGSLYPALLALEQDGFVTSRWETAPAGSGGATSRKVYTITPAGLAELTRRTQDWRRFVASIERVLGGAEDGGGAEPDVQPA